MGGLTLLTSDGAKWLGFRIANSAIKMNLFHLVVVKVLINTSAVSTTSWGSKVNRIVSEGL